VRGRIRSASGALAPAASASGSPRLAGTGSWSSKRVPGISP